MTPPAPATGQSSRELSTMGSREDSVRGRVTSKRAKCPEQEKEWDTRETMMACIDADGELEAAGLEPAPKFRQALKMNHQRYVRAWVLGCHFDWLNPRGKGRL